MSRETVEEVENAFLRIKPGCKLIDPQPGLIILLNQNAIQSLNLTEIPPMIGDIVITHQLLRKGYKIIEPPVLTRKQKRTLSTYKKKWKKYDSLKNTLGFHLKKL